MPPRGEGSGLPTVATNAVAAKGPMVSTVINRRQTSFSRASDRICLSNVSTEFAPQQDVQAAIAKAPPHRADLAQTDPYGHGHTGYCNPEVDKLIDQQSAEADPAKRKQLVWQIERRLAGRRPADHLLPARRDLHAALCHGARDHGQQHLQRLSHGGCLARQVAAARRR
jgi:hypothetical protein